MKLPGRNSFSWQQSWYWGWATRRGTREGCRRGLPAAMGVSGNRDVATKLRAGHRDLVVKGLRRTGQIGCGYGGAQAQPRGPTRLRRAEIAIEAAASSVTQRREGSSRSHSCPARGRIRRRPATSGALSELAPRGTVPIQRLDDDRAQAVRAPPSMRPGSGRSCEAAAAESAYR